MQKNALCCFEKILEAAPHKRVTVRPLTFHLSNHLSKISKICWLQLEIHKRYFPWIPTQGQTSVSRTAKDYTRQFCADTWCCVEDLPTAIDDGDELREGVKEIMVISGTGLYIYIYIYSLTLIHQYIYVYIKLMRVFCKYL